MKTLAITLAALLAACVVDRRPTRYESRPEPPPKDFYSLDVKPHRESGTYLAGSAVFRDEPEQVAYFPMDGRTARVRVMNSAQTQTRAWFKYSFACIDNPRLMYPSMFNYVVPKVFDAPLGPLGIEIVTVKETGDIATQSRDGRTNPCPAYVMKLERDHFDPSPFNVFVQVKSGGVK